MVLMALAMRSWASSLSCSHMKRYLVYTKDDHPPKICTISWLAPAEKRKLAPPRLNECPLKRSGLSPAFPKTVFKRAVNWV